MSQIRIDKWLWQARFFKTRSLSAKLVSGGHVRVNGAKVGKPAHKVGPGDTLTFPQGHDILVIKVLGLGERRGPAPEARQLYENLTPIKDKTPRSPRYEGKGRPDKKQRRQMQGMKSPPLE